MKCVKIKIWQIGLLIGLSIGDLLEPGRQQSELKSTPSASAKPAGGTTMGSGILFRGEEKVVCVQVQE